MRYMNLWDEVVKLRDMRFVDIDGFIVLTVPNATRPELRQGCRFSEWATGQLCARFGVKPWVVWCGVQTSTSVTLLNEIAGNSDKSYKLRGSDSTIRAVVGDKWQPLDNDYLKKALSLVSVDGSISSSVSTYNERMLAFCTSDIDSHGSIIEACGVTVYGSEVGALVPSAIPTVVTYDTHILVPRFSSQFRKSEDQAAAAFDMINVANKATPRAIEAVRKVTELGTMSDVNDLVGGLCAFIKAREHRKQCFTVASDLAWSVGSVNALIPIVAMSRIANSFPTLEGRMQLLYSVGTAVSGWRPR